MSRPDDLSPVSRLGPPLLAERRRYAREETVPDVEARCFRGMTAEAIYDHRLRAMRLRVAAEVLQRRTTTRHETVTVTRTTERRVVDADRMSYRILPETWRDGLLLALVHRLDSLALALQWDPVWCDYPGNALVWRAATWLSGRARRLCLWTLPAGAWLDRPGQVVRVVTAESTRTITVETVHACPHLALPPGDGPVAFRAHVGWLAAVDDPEGAARGRHELAAAARTIDAVLRRHDVGEWLLRGAIGHTEDVFAFVEAMRTVNRVAARWGAGS